MIFSDEDATKETIDEEGWVYTGDTKSFTTPDTIQKIREAYRR